jgi:hypothetical protein
LIPPVALVVIHEVLGDFVFAASHHKEQMPFLGSRDDDSRCRFGVRPSVDHESVVNNIDNGRGLTLPTSVLKGNLSPHS